MTEALLHYAARRDHVERTIRPALAAGAWVLCDRFADSTWPIRATARGLRGIGSRRCTRLVLGEFEPDLTLILDLPVERG